VPYNVVQQEKTLRIDFAASSIPPKPYEDADLPEWKKVLAEAPTTSAKMAEKGDMPSTEKASPTEKKSAEKRLPAQKRPKPLKSDWLPYRRRRNIPVKK
jgi:hypothetical protein